MTPTRESIYAAEYERRQRDPIIDYVNQASVPNGRMSRWERFNRSVELIYVHDAEGHPRALTPKQYAVYQLAVDMIEGPMFTMRAMSAELGVNVSTVSRALAKLQAWGILVYMVGRGRFAGLVIVRYIRDGGFLDAKRKAAKARVRRWYEASQRRLSRLQFNVAPYFHERGRGIKIDSLYYYVSSISMDATLTVQLPWTAEEVSHIR